LLSYCIETREKRNARLFGSLFLRTADTLEICMITSLSFYADFFGVGFLFLFEVAKRVVYYLIACIIGCIGI